MSGKIVVISDSFKECMNSLEIANILSQTCQQVDPDILVDRRSVSDGGEGFVESALLSGTFTAMESLCCDPYLHQHTALWGRHGQEAVIEMAQCSGLSLCQPRNPLKTSTYGTGLQIRDALDQGCNVIWLGLGGSGTHDCGCGIACALGVRFYHGNESFLPTGETLDQIDRIDLSQVSEKARKMKLVCCCDVDNPICGPQGAAYVFAAQKGADENQIRILEKNSHHLLKLIEKQFSCSLENKPGLGAAGGCGLILNSLFHCITVNGLEKSLQWLDLSTLFQDCDLVITGEGKIDEQSLHGKVPFGILKLAQKENKPVLAICGQLRIEPQRLKQAGFCDVLVLQKEQMSTQESIIHAAELLNTEFSRWLKDRKEESL